MTKAQELETLDAAIKKLGPDSYLGPWLAGIRGEVESMIRSDFFPDNTLAETTKRCKQLVDDTKRDTAEMVTQAQFVVRNLRAEADRDINARIDDAMGKLALAKRR